MLNDYSSTVAKTEIARNRTKFLVPDRTRGASGKELAANRDGAPEARRSRSEIRAETLPGSGAGRRRKRDLSFECA